MTPGSDGQEQAVVRATSIEHHDAEAGRFVLWYEEMAASRFANAFAYGRAKVDRLLEGLLATLAPAAQVLDVGCGTGQYVRRAAALGFSASGIEPAEAMRKVAVETNPGSAILPGLATGLPFPDRAFDLVICIEVLRYLHPADQRQALREMHRVLRPGGTLFLTSVNRYALDGFYLHYRLRRLLSGKGASAEAPHCEFTTPARIDAEVRAAGFATAAHHGVLFAPMRLIYKLSTPLARRVAPALEPLDDAICATRMMRPFAGHLVTIAVR